MKAGAIIIIAIAATGVLLMRFRKRWLAMINIAFHEPNHRAIRRLASGFRHSHARGSKIWQGLPSPVNVFRTPSGFVIALTYSSQSEWVKNVLASHGCELKTRGRKYQLSAPTVVRDPARRQFPIAVRCILRLVGADEYIRFQNVARI